MKAAWRLGRGLLGPEGQPGGGLSRWGAGSFGMGTGVEVMGMMATRWDGDHCGGDGHDGDRAAWGPWSKGLGWVPCRI